MAKIRKVKRSKKFNYMNKKKKKNSHMPKAKMQSLPTVSKVWNKKQSNKKNIKRLGLQFDVNDDLKMDVTTTKTMKKVSSVVEALEQEAKAPRVKAYRMPKGQVEIITYMMNTYGEDYKAMTRDKRNELQCTWKQFRRMINKFKTIPEQYDAYVASKMETETTN